MLLHVHFTSNRKEVTADDDMLNLVLGQNVIKCVKDTKFLGVIIDNKLSWDAHIKYLNSKLKCEIGKDAYMAKFQTCARTRTFESRILGREFFQREPSKPLFCNNSLLTVHNLYKYHCIV